MSEDLTTQAILLRVQELRAARQRRWTMLGMLSLGEIVVFSAALMVLTPKLSSDDPSDIPSVAAAPSEADTPKGLAVEEPVEATAAPAVEAIADAAEEEPAEVDPVAEEPAEAAPSEEATAEEPVAEATAEPIDEPAGDAVADMGLTDPPDITPPDSAPPSPAPAGCQAGQSCSPMVVSAFPYTHDGDTIGAESKVDSYSCAPWVGEAGGEIWYAVTLDEPGRLRARINEDPYDGVDVDVHLLEKSGPDSCLDRGNRSVSKVLQPGEYWVVIDTCSDSGMAKPGAYTVSMSFTASK